MKTIHPWLELATFCISSFFLYGFVLGAPSPGAPVCSLDFNTYIPSGICMGEREKVILWGIISSTVCCRNALNALSQVLAARANESQNTFIFLDHDSWTNCNFPFLSQKSVSMESCGFGNFYSGSSSCSNLKLSDIQSNVYYPPALSLCSNLGISFENICKNCTEAIANLVESLLATLETHEDRTLCSLAAVISVAAANGNNSTFSSYLFSCMSSLDNFDPGKIKMKRSTANALYGACIVASVLILILVLMKCATSESSKNIIKTRIILPRRTPSKDKVTWSGLYNFSKDEIENAINNNNRKKCLGRGSAGEVYEGILPSGQLVAIKHIRKGNATDSFKSEVTGLSRIRHPNLVSLLGCCIDGEEQYLVLEYCPGGNLAQNLLRKDSVLPWEDRVKILRGCALGLRYLHAYIGGCIVHRDIKLTNILLDENLEPKLSDFGLARLIGLEESQVFTDVRGTIGYLDPEYMTNAKLTSASDVYSFGIVALQLLSGQKVIELDLAASEQLTRKAKDVNMGKRQLTDFEDPRLQGNLNRTDFESILQIAVLCVAKSSRGRPPIDVVFDEMDKAWKNTDAYKKTTKENGPPASESPSRSMEVISV